MNYWSCSAFADWLRGTPKFEAATGKEWKNWKKAAKAAYPIRFWLAEEGLDKIQNFVNFIPDQIHKIRYYVNNRWVSRSHALTAHPRDIKPGAWQDVGYRFLPCLFNELVDFVEIELAWHNCRWDDKAARKFQVPWWRKNWFRWRAWRCPEAGLDHLYWQIGLHYKEEDGFEAGDPHIGQRTSQSCSAQEILELYVWWTRIYPTRPDVHDLSGWSAYCDKKREIMGEDSLLDFEDSSEELTEMRKTSLSKLQEIEQAYNDEDEDMLIRLIKIRHHLWT